MNSDPDRTGEGADSIAESAPPSPAHDLHAAIDAEHGEGLPPTWLPMRILEWLGALVIVALTLGISYSVAVRAAGQGLTGAIELAGLAMIFVVILGAPGLALRDEHVRLELADFILGKKALKALHYFGLVFQLVVVVLLCFAMWQVLEADLRRGTTVAGDLRLPRYWVSGSVLAGFVVLGLALIRSFIDSIRHKNHAPTLGMED
ncbi:TRAP transporter small permease [Granulicoccus sp. GXG6511]|uniref:TRAP transporter small permease n=1 Tax=Granulicoccus sp. GXG6511 TaxID=3381351 RepID=UPI003D7E11C2